MAAAEYTLTVTKKKYVGEALFATGTVISDGGDYAAGGFVVAPTFESLETLSGANGSPDFVSFEPILPANGYRYDYDNTSKKLIIRVATTAGTNAIEGQHTAAAVVAAARTGIKWFAVWLTKLTPDVDRGGIPGAEV